MTRRCIVAAIAIMANAFSPVSDVEAVEWERIAVRTTPVHGPSSLLLPADLARPATSDPTPAIVMLPGCSGVWKIWSDPWAEFFLALGYAVLEIDSLGPRGFPQGICESGGVGAYSISEDAHAAKAYLQTLPYIDGNRIAVFGMSGGGEAVIWAAMNSPLAKRPRSDPFQAAIGLYAYCSSILHRVDTPILLLSAERDYWTPPARCTTMVANAPEGTRIRHVIFPGATHAFDIDLPERTYLGHVMAHDSEATRESRREVQDFLARHFR